MNREKGFAPVIIVFIVLLLTAGAYFLGTKKGNLGLSPSLATPNPTSSTGCSPTSVSGYDVATIVTNIDSKGVATTKPAQLQGDLKGDGRSETIILYAQIPGEGGRSLPVITKIFSGTQTCLTEEFSFTGKESQRNGNELHTAQIIPNFWGDGRTVLDVENESTGYGSGSTYFLNFIVYANGSYQVVNGPTVGSDILYAFKGVGGIGKEILVGTPVWTGTEAHFDPHIYQFEKFVWDGQKYNDIKLGTTKNKYQATIDQIVQAEPSVLQSQ